MPVVPIRPDAQPTFQSQSRAPPPDTYLLMAAAQMHKEGRLVQPASSLQDLTEQSLKEGTGAEEWEPQLPYQTYDPSEPDADDKSMDIMRKLEINKGMAKLGYRV